MSDLNDVTRAQERTAEAAEDAAQEARRQRVAMESLAKGAERAEEHRLQELDILSSQSRSGERDREYHRNLAFLKECNEEDKLQRYVEMFLETLGAPFSDENYQQKKALISHVYTNAGLPEECKPNGAVTMAIRSAATGAAPVPEELQAVTAAIADATNEMSAVNSEIKQKRELITEDTQFGRSFRRMLLRLSGKGTQADKQKAKLAQEVAELARLETRTGAIEAQLADLSAERRRLEEAAEAARPQLVHDCVRKWQAALLDYLLRDFFAQGLWIEDRFVEKLRPALESLQKPFPSKCKTNLRNVTVEQRNALFEAVTDQIGVKISHRISIRGDMVCDGDLANVIIGGTFWEAIDASKKLMDKGYLNEESPRKIRDKQVKELVRQGILDDGRTSEPDELLKKDVLAVLHGGPTALAALE